MTDISWPDRQHALHDKLAAIKAREAANVIAGKDYDLAELISAEAELELLRSAESEDRRRQEAEEAKLIAARRSAIKAEIKDLIEERAAAFDAAEAATEALAEALAMILGKGDEIDRKLKLLGEARGTGQMPTDIKASIGHRICLRLHPVTGNKLGFLDIRKLGGPMLPDGSKPADSWREADEKRTNLKAILKRIPA